MRSRMTLALLAAAAAVVLLAAVSTLPASAAVRPACPGTHPVMLYVTDDVTVTPVCAATGTVAQSDQDRARTCRSRGHPGREDPVRQQRRHRRDHRAYRDRDQHRYQHGDQDHQRRPGSRRDSDHPERQDRLRARQQSGTVTPIRTATSTALKPIQVGQVPARIAITPDGKTAYVTNAGSGTVTPIRTATNTALKPIQVGSNPLDDRDHPEREDRLCRQHLGKSVTPIRIATNTALKPINDR